MVDRDLARDPRAHRVPDHHRLAEFELVHQVDDVAGEILDQVAALRLRRVAVPWSITTGTPVASPCST
jgi:hypothetical protein